MYRIVTCLGRLDTIRYKTYLKQCIVEALQAVFEVHPDSLLQDTKVRLEHSFEEADYPTIIVGFQETDIKDAGIGHYERKQLSVTPNIWLISVSWNPTMHRRVVSLFE